MKAQALITHQGPNFVYEDVILPDPSPKNILVQALYSGISIGTEFAYITRKLDNGPYPLCTGYQGIGVVKHVGDKIQGFKVDDRVYYRRNQEIQLANGQNVSVCSGVHCSYAILEPDPTHGIALLPEGIDEETASLFVMPAVGLNGVDMANPRMGDSVAIYGCGLIGLGVVAACSHRGCIVFAIDIQNDRLKVAQNLGADHILNSTTGDVSESLKKIAPEGADVVFESTGIPTCIDPAMQLCKRHGKFVFQGNYGKTPISTNFLLPHGKRITAFYPCDDGFVPCRKAVLKNIATGVLPWKLTITHRANSHDAPDLYKAIHRGEAKNVIGAVINWT